jgi:hypothetical protein
MPIGKIVQSPAHHIAYAASDEPQSKQSNYESLDRRKRFGRPRSPSLGILVGTMDMGLSELLDRSRCFSEAGLANLLLAPTDFAVA